MSDKREGEISPHQMQKRTGCHISTAYRWCYCATNHDSGPIAGAVRRDVTGHYWIKAEAVDELLSK
jgi:hypothetical protein